MKNITDKIQYWLDQYPTLRDNDERLCANIWHDELLHLGYEKQDFLSIYAKGKLTSAASIKRLRAKLQEVNTKYRGEKYYKRKGIYQDSWKEKLGYN
jgi:hypothetical protein